MADTIRTMTAILSLMEIGGQRAISAQDIRDFIVSIWSPEYLAFRDPGSDPAHVAGTVYYRGGTFNFMRDVDGVIANLPEEQQTPLVTNRTGAQIDNGTVVYVDGVQGNTPKIAPASKDDATANRTIAVATHDIANLANGYATTFGMVRGLDTRGPGAETWTEGDEIYLGNAGTMTNVRPSGSDAVVSLGIVTVVSPSIGEVLISIRRIAPIYLDVGITEARPLAASTSYQNLYVWSWDDLFFPVLDSDRKQTQLTVEEYRDTEQTKSFADRGGTTLLSLDYQMPHRWAGTAVRFHAHIIPCGVSDGTAEFEGRYFFGGIDDELPAASGWTSYTKSVPLLGADQWDLKIPAIVTCAAPASPGHSDILRLVFKRVTDSYNGNKDDGNTAAANICIESLDVHYQALLTGSEEEFTGEVSINPSRVIGDPTSLPGRGQLYARLQVKTDAGNPCSFRIYDDTTAAVVQLVGGGDAEVTGVTSTDYYWVEIGPLDLAAATREYRVQAKYDSAADEPWLGKARILAR